MKKAIALLLCVLFLTASLASCGNSETEANPASDFKYAFTENDEYVLINQYIGKSKDVVIPSEIEGRTVTSITGLTFDGFMQGAFQGSDIETVVIPNTVKYIGSSTFKNCTKLSTVTFKSGSELHTIEAEAFSDCSALKEINLEDAKKLTTVGKEAFFNCSSIEKLILAANLESVGASAFYGCTSLKSVAFMSTFVKITALDGAIFAEVPSLEEIVFEDGCQSIEGYMIFYITSDVKITIPASVKSVGAYVFSNKGSMKITFMGDCPQILDSDRFDGDVTIYYNTNTKGWDTTSLKDAHSLMPR